MDKYILGSGAEEECLIIDVPENIKSIGVFISGGLDSTILLYALLTYRKNNSKTFGITALTVNKTTSNLYSKRILNKLENLFCSIPHVQDIDNSGSEAGAVTQAIARMKSDCRFDLIYTGVNANPPERLIKIRGPYPKRPSSNSHKNLVLPFMNLFKSHIIELAYILRADWILPYTHSCTEVDFGECFQCFACQERAWGFSANNKIDQGLIKLNTYEV